MREIRWSRLNVIENQINLDDEAKYEIEIKVKLIVFQIKKNVIK